MRRGRRKPPAPGQGDWAVIYDGACGLCRLCVALLLVCDRRGRLRPVPMDDPRAAPLRGTMAAAQWQASWHLAGPDGRLRSGGAAIPVVCRLLPGFGPLGRLCGAGPDVTQRIYAWVAGHRSRIGPWIPRVWLAWAGRRLDARVDGR